MKKLIIFLILVALFVGGRWFLSQKTVFYPTGLDMSDWHTFQNEKYSYEVKYPAGVSKVGDSESNRVDLNFESYVGVSQDLINSSGGEISLFTLFSVEQASNPKNLPLKDWLYGNMFNGHRGPLPGPTEKEITLAGFPAYYTEQNFPGKGGLYAYTRYTIYTLHGGNLYQISGVKPPKSPTPAWLAHPYYQYLEKSIPVSEAILNSFKFTN